MGKGEQILGKGSRMTDQHSLDQLPGFGKFRIDFEEGLLFLEGKVVALRPKGFAALSVLYQNLNKTVEYEQIGRLAWQLKEHQRVETHNVQTTVGEVARKLGDSHGARIENVPYKKGYRLATDEYLAEEAERGRISDIQFQAREEVGAVTVPGLEATVVFDGITLNKAAELMYDTEATVAEREASGITYVRSLEDFTLGVVFGERVLSGAVREISKGVAPVEDLRREFGTDRIQQFSAGFALEPSDLLDPKHDERTAIEGLLEQLCNALERDRESWREHAIREIRWIGRDINLSVVAKDPVDYHFERDFWPDRVLQQHVPPEFLDYMIKIARSRPELAKTVHDAALREYYSRNALAHILIFRWYQMAAERDCALGAGVFFPHATRASLVPSESSMPRTSEVRVEGPIWRLKRLVLPRIILDLLNLSLDRKDFRKWLSDYAHKGVYREHRELFATIVASLSQQRVREADQAVDHLDKLCRAGATDNIRCGQFSTHPHRNVALPFATRQAPAMSDYLTALKRVFPELGLDGKPNVR